MRDNHREAAASMTALTGGFNAKSSEDVHASSADVADSRVGLSGIGNHRAGDSFGDHQSR